MDKARKYAVTARVPQMSLTDYGHLHVCHLMHLLHCSRQTIYTRVRQGTLPKPDGMDGRRPFWNTKTIRPIFE
jgi:predicted DNA-binding transcriptional regulator AlpA